MFIPHIRTVPILGLRPLFWLQATDVQTFGSKLVTRWSSKVGDVSFVPLSDRNQEDAVATLLHEIRQDARWNHREGVPLESILGEGEKGRAQLQQVAWDTSTSHAVVSFPCTLHSEYRLKPDIANNMFLSGKTFYYYL